MTEMFAFRALGAVHKVHIMLAQFLDFQTIGFITPQLKSDVHHLRLSSTRIVSRSLLQAFLELGFLLQRWVMCQRTASANRWWWTRRRSCVRPSSTGWMSPMSTTVSKGSQKTSRVKLSFSQNNHISKRLRVHTIGGGWGQGFEVWQVYLYLNLKAMVSGTLQHLGSTQIIWVYSG